LLAVLIDEAFATELGEEAGDGFARDAGHAAEFFVGEGHGEGYGEVGMDGRNVEVVHACPIEECAGQPAGGGGGMAEAAGAEKCCVVVAGDGDGGDGAEFGGVVHEAEEVGSGDGEEGGGTERDCGETVVSGGG